MIHDQSWIILPVPLCGGPARIIHEASTAAADPCISAALPSVGLLDVLSSTPAAPVPDATSGAKKQQNIDGSGGIGRRKR
jgi:hypothetical protein